MEIIHPIVKEYCDNRDMGSALQKVHPREAGDVLRPEGMKNSGIKYSAVEALAFEAGIFERTVQDIYRGKAKRDTRSGRPGTQVKWATVDKLLTAMNLVHLWYEEPLVAYYTPRPSPSVLQSAA